MAEPAVAATTNKSAQAGAARARLYAGVGAELVHYEVDVGEAALIRKASVNLPGNLLYAWPHASRRYFYVATSDYVRRGPPTSAHHLCAFRVDPETGALRAHGEAVQLPNYATHMSTDIPSEHALVTYPKPSSISVHRIRPDGTIGGEVKQNSLDSGIHPHQIRLTPSNAAAIVVCRGEVAKRDKPEQLGALKVFEYHHGLLRNKASVAPNVSHDFGPRHLDFHPTGPWVYVTLEHQSKLYTYRLDGDELGAEPLFRSETLAEPHDVPHERKQMAGAIHVHPNGRFVYVANRAYSLMNYEGSRVFRGGENNIAVYAIDQRSGEPTLIQHMDTRGFYTRTFALDPSGKILIAANMIPIPVRNGTALETVPASLAVFRVADDGRLDYVRKYDVDLGDATSAHDPEVSTRSIYWMGVF
jgi:6-phosphogluconolactonase (cycloisomerase 2 family)